MKKKSILVGFSVIMLSGPCLAAQAVNAGASLALKVLGGGALVNAMYKRIIKPAAADLGIIEGKPHYDLNKEDKALVHVVRELLSVDGTNRELLQAVALDAVRQQEAGPRHPQRTSEFNKAKLVIEDSVAHQPLFQDGLAQATLLQFSIAGALNLKQSDKVAQYKTERNKLLKSLDLVDGHVLRSLQHELRALQSASSDSITTFPSSRTEEDDMVETGADSYFKGSPVHPSEGTERKTARDS